MQHDYYERLSQDVKVLVDEVEHGCGFQIEVRPDVRRAGLGVDGAGTLACVAEPRNAFIDIPPGHFPDGAVVHELLHLRRFLLQGVPMLYVDEEQPIGTSAFADGIHKLDNALEHLVIVPIELGYRADRVAYWTRILESIWRQDIPAFPDEEDKARWAKVHWTFVRHVLSDTAVSPLAEQLLQDMGILAEANALHDAVISALAKSKEDATRICLGLLGLPAERVGFEYLDTKRGTRHFERFLAARPT